MLSSPEAGRGPSCRLWAPGHHTPTCTGPRPTASLSSGQGAVLPHGFGDTSLSEGVWNLSDFLRLRPICGHCCACKPTIPSTGPARPRRFAPGYTLPRELLQVCGAAEAWTHAGRSPGPGVHPATHGTWSQDESGRLAAHQNVPMLTFGTVHQRGVKRAAEHTRSRRPVHRSEQRAGSRRPRGRGVGQRGSSWPATPAHLALLSKLVPASSSLLWGGVQQSPLHTRGRGRQPPRGTGRRVEQHRDMAVSCMSQISRATRTWTLWNTCQEACLSGLPTRTRQGSVNVTHVTRVTPCTNGL